MALTTAFTELFSLQYPVALAPMGGCAGGALAAAVSNGGGLGLIGGGSGEQQWLDRELAIAATLTTKPWGVGFQSWAVDGATIQRTLELGPDAVMLSFGDPSPFTAVISASRSRLILQVTNLEEARQARDSGADIIVAQGSEAGGHGGRRATLPFVPAVVDLVAPIPVLAAGGIVDGRGLAAALVLGAAGALMGTRFQASLEALVPTAHAQAIVESTGEDTERNRVLDIARGSAWPERYTARTLRNPFLDRWTGRESELSHDSEALTTYEEGARRDDLAVVPVWAGEGIDLITDITSAWDMVAAFAVAAEAALSRAGRT